MPLASPLQVCECLQVPRGKTRRSKTIWGEAPILGCLLSEQTFHSPLLKNTQLSSSHNSFGVPARDFGSLLFFPCGLSKGMAFPPPPAACIVLHSRDLIDCCHLMLRRCSRVHSAHCWVLLKETQIRDYLSLRDFLQMFISDWKSTRCEEVPKNMGNTIL